MTRRCRALCRSLVTSMGGCGRSLPTKLLHHVHDHEFHQHAYEVWKTCPLVMLNTLKSGDELISMKETNGPCEGRAE